MGRVLVLGNAGLDLTLRLPRLPLKGETLLGDSTGRAPGGKGLNQAVAAVRTGMPVVFHAPVGHDAQADEIEAALKAEGFAGLELHRMPNASDFSLLMVLPDGDNSIASAGSCAAAFTAAMAHTVAATAAHGDVMAVQGNLTKASTEAALIEAKARGATTLFNPAPLWWDVRPVLAHCDVVVMNSGEAQTVTGRSEPAEAAAFICDQGAGFAVVTLGAEGCLTYDGRVLHRYPAPVIEAVDTTGCGDTFCGVLAAMLGDGRAHHEAVALAQSAAGLTAQRPGAFAALPNRAEFAALVAQHEAGR